MGAGLGRPGVMFFIVLDVRCFLYCFRCEIGNTTQKDATKGWAVCQCRQVDLVAQKKLPAHLKLPGSPPTSPGPVYGFIWPPLTPAFYDLVVCQHMGQSNAATSPSMPFPSNKHPGPCHAPPLHGQIHHRVQGGVVAGACISHVVPVDCGADSGARGAVTQSLT